MPEVKFTANNREFFDRVQIQVKVLPGVRDKLRSIPCWQDKLREKIDSLIVENFDSVI